MLLSSNSEPMTRPIWAIFLGGLACAILDGAAAMVLLGIKGTNPLRLWQGVASGLLGATAFRQGRKSVALGLTLHCIIAFAFAAAFVLACRSTPLLAREFLVSGPAYGVFVFLFMNLIVVPLSAKPKAGRSPGQGLTQLAVHMVFVGLPIAISAHFSLLQRMDEGLQVIWR